MRDVWEIDMVGRTSSERLGYPTQKPIALYERIKASSNPGELVLDPFAGCGTTIEAAAKNGRAVKCFSIEEYYRNNEQWERLLTLPSLANPWTGKPMQKILFEA